MQASAAWRREQRSIKAISQTAARKRPIASNTRLLLSQLRLQHSPLPVVSSHRQHVCMTLRGTTSCPVSSPINPSLNARPRLYAQRPPRPPSPRAPSLPAAKTMEQSTLSTDPQAVVDSGSSDSTLNREAFHRVSALLGKHVAAVQAQHRQELLDVGLVLSCDQPRSTTRLALCRRRTCRP